MDRAVVHPDRVTAGSGFGHSPGHLDGLTGLREFGRRPLSS